MRWFIPGLSVWASPLTNLEEHFGILCQLDISTSKEHLFLLIKSHSFKVFHIVTPMTFSGHGPSAWLNSSIQSCQHKQPTSKEICRGEPKEVVVIKSYPALPGGLTSGENQTSTTDDSTDKLTRHTLPKSSTHLWVTTFSV